MVNESVKIVFVFPSATRREFWDVVAAPPKRVWLAVMVFVPFVEKINPLGLALLFDPACRVRLPEVPLNVNALNSEKVILAPLESPMIVLVAELLMTRLPPVTIESPLPPEVVVNDEADCVVFPRLKVPPPMAMAPPFRARICPRVRVPL